MKDRYKVEWFDDEPTSKIRLNRYSYRGGDMWFNHTTQSSVFMSYGRQLPTSPSLAIKKAIKSYGRLIKKKKRELYRLEEGLAVIECIEAEKE